MSDETKNTAKKRTYPQRMPSRLNLPAYNVHLKEYFDLMVEEGKFKKIEQDKAFGKYRGLTYELPNGNWAQLDVASDVLDKDKPTTFREYNPKTNHYRMHQGKDGQKTIKASNIFDAMQYSLGITDKERWTTNKAESWRKLREEAFKRIGIYPAKQITTSDEKINEKATKELNNRENLTDDEVRLDEEIRNTMIKDMGEKMIKSIRETGTLFGTEPLDMPVWVRSKDISHMIKRNEWDGHWTLRDQGKFPGNDGHFGQTVQTVDGKTTVVNHNMQGFLYVAAMLDGHPDKRYMEVNDMLNGTRFRENGQKMSKGKNPYWTPNFIYGGDFGFKTHSDGKVPKIERHRITGEDGKSFYGFKIDPAQAKDHITPAIWVEHKPLNHLTIKNFVNVEDIAVRPLQGDPNDHKEDKFILPKHTKQSNLDYVVNKMIEKYGKGITDEKAFKAEPFDKMRSIIGILTENSKIRMDGMKAFQRELTLDYIARDCGYHQGVIIPEQDREKIISWIKNDFLKENPKERGKRFIDATIAMDRNSAKLRGLTDKAIALKVQEAMERPKFKNVSMAFRTDYTTTAGQKIPMGTGGPMSIPLEGETAYKLLSDICVKDKMLFDNSKDEAYRKTLRFDLTVGDQKFEDITISMGRLDTGNESTVADSIVNVLTRRARNAAYMDNDFKKEFAEINALRESGFLKKDFQDMDKTGFSVKKRAAFQSLDAELKKTFAEFREDEVNYLETKRISGKPFENDNSRITADVYRYEVPTENKTLLYEAYGPNNVLNIRKPDRHEANLPNSLVVELRKPLEPVKGETQEGKIVGKTDERNNVVYRDETQLRQKGTEALDAIPYCKREELEKMSAFEKKFTVDITSFNEDGSERTIQYQGAKARNMLLKLANTDQMSFEKEKEGLRSIRHIDPIHVAARWEHEPIFEKEDRVGTKAFSNGHSIEEIISGQKESLSDKGKEALSAMLSADHVYEKYGTDRDLNAMLTKSEIMEKEEIDKVLKAPKKVEEYQKPENIQDISQIDRLQTEAIVNLKETDQEIMNHIVDGMLKETPLRGQKAVNAMQEAIQKERPEMMESFKKSMERKIVQKKLSATKGIRRGSSNQEQGRL